IGVLGTICLMFLGWFAAWKGLRPVQKMAKVAEGISAQHLSERLEVENTPTELKSLAIAFNDMLDRLETAVEKLSDFSSDLAHEIRTPINNLMTQTQVCLSRSRDINTYQEVLFSNLEEFERLARMVSDMLFLAKAEHGLHLPNLQQVNLVKEVSALFDFYDAIAAEKGMLLEQTGYGSVKGDPSMLRRALSNLLSNAIKYGKTDSVIKIKYQQNFDTTVFTIENESSPLSSDQLNRLFDRFYRTDASRQRVEEGTGLGLAITKSILDVHGATIQATYEDGRIIFKIVFKN
ncbi:heavy metal sensor histidine kinase, partial [Acinetobacter baumannii]|nr:heavy metal sensor histidine kinase [Acinetobacter baumannii]